MLPGANACAWTPHPPLLASDAAALSLRSKLCPHGVFAGLRFLFWVVAFTGPLKTG